MQYGKKVTVHLYGGTTGLRRVVRDYGDVVVICSEDEFNNSIKENRRARGIGFPEADVIRPVDAELAEEELNIIDKFLEAKEANGG